MQVLKCSGEKDCNGNVTHLDDKGFVYCAIHGPIRSTYIRCRKLNTKELAQLKLGKPLKSYSKGA